MKSKGKDKMTDFGVLENEVRNRGLQLVEMRGQINSPEVLRVPRTVGFLPFDFNKRDVEFKETYRNDITNMLSTYLNATDCLTIGIYVHDGTAAFYLFTKGEPFTDQRFRGATRAIGAGEPISVMDPFGVAKKESVVARRIAKGSLETVGHRFGGILSYARKEINYDLDMYYLFDGEPIGDLMSEFTKMAVGESSKWDMHGVARFYITFQFRNVHASDAGGLTIASKYKTMQPDAKKRLEVPQQEYQEQKRLQSEFKRRFPDGMGVQVEAQVILVYPSDMDVKRADYHIDSVVNVGVNTVNGVSLHNANVPGRSTLPRSKLYHKSISMEDAVQYYVTSTFLKGKDEHKDGKKGKFPPPEDYFRRDMLPEGVKSGKSVGTDKFSDRAVSLPEAAYFFPLIGKSVLTGLHVSPEAGSCVFFPFYFSLYKRVYGKIPPNLSIFEHIGDQKDVGFDSRFIDSREYFDFMRKINVPVHGSPEPEGKKIIKSDEATMSSEDAEKLPPLEKDDIRRLFTDDDMHEIERFRGGIDAILGVVRPQGNFSDVTGPSAQPGEGFRAWISGGSGSGKSTVAAALAVEGQANGYTVIVPELNNDMVGKVFKILIDRYGNNQGILDRVEFIMAGNNSQPSIHPINLMHLSIPGLDTESRYGVILNAGTASREARVNDAFTGLKILQHLKNFVLSYMDVSTDSTLVDILNCFDDPTEGKNTLSSRSENSGAKRNSAVESALSALNAQIKNPRSEEFMSTRRFIDGMVGTKFLKRMLNDRESNFVFSEFLRPDKPKIIFLYFPYPAVSEENAVTAIAAYIEMFYMQKLALNQLSDGTTFRNPEGGKPLTYRDSKMLIVADEFHKYWNEGLKTIVTQGRKEGVSIALLTQDFRVKGSENKEIYGDIKSNFNFRLFRDVRNAEDVWFLGLGDKLDAPRILGIFNEINDITGRFYLDGLGIREHVVSTLYDISEHQPEFIKSIIDAIYRKYEQLDAADGKKRLRMLSDADVEQMSKPITSDTNFVRLCVLEALYYLNDIKDSKVPVSSIAELAKNMFKRSAALRTILPSGDESKPLFADFSDKFSDSQINEALRYYMEDNRVERWGEKRNNVYVYRILPNGEELLKESLGVGSSGGGDMHRDYELDIAKAVMQSSMVSFEEGKSKGKAYAFLNLNARAGPDLQIDFTQSPIELITGGTITMLQVEIELQYNKGIIIKKINALPNGWHLLFYVQPGLVDTFRRGINSIEDKELMGGSTAVTIDRVQVRSLADIDKSLNEFYRSMEKKRPFTESGGGDSGNQVEKKTVPQEGAGEGEAESESPGQVVDVSDKCPPVRTDDGKGGERLKGYVDKLNGMRASWPDLGKFLDLNEKEKERRLCLFLCAIRREGSVTGESVETEKLWKLKCDPFTELSAAIFELPGDSGYVRKRQFASLLIEYFLIPEFGKSEEFHGDDSKDYVCGNRFYYGGRYINGIYDLSMVDGKEDGRNGFFLVNPDVINPASLCSECLKHVGGLYVEDKEDYSGLSEGWLNAIAEHIPIVSKGNDETAGKSMGVVTGNEVKSLGSDTTIVSSDKGRVEVVNKVKNAIDKLFENHPSGVEIIESISEIKDVRERSRAAVRVAISTAYFRALNRFEELGVLMGKNVYVPVDENKVYSFSRVYVGNYNTNIKEVKEYINEFETSGVILMPGNEGTESYRIVVGNRSGVLLVNIGKFPFTLSREIYESEEACRIVINVVVQVDRLVEAFKHLLAGNK